MRSLGKLLLLVVPLLLSACGGGDDDSPPPTPAGAPVFTVGPQAGIYEEGAAVTMTAAATGNGTVTYQWLFNSSPIPGATSASLSFTNIRPANGGQYDVVATNSLNGTQATANSASAIVEVASIPVFTTQPVSATVTEGMSMTLACVATANGPLFYRWFRNNAIVGTDSTFRANPVTMAHAGVYTCVVTNNYAAGLAAPSAASQGATIMVVPAAGKMSALPTTPRYGHTLTALSNGGVLAVGGKNSTACNCTTFQASVDLFDPGTNEWSRTSSLLTAREGHTATLLSDGRVLVAGGYGGETNSTADTGRVLSSSEIFDPKTRAWTPTGAMNSPRRDHVAILLGDGRVMVTGGSTGSAALATGEIFDPATGAWTTADR